MGLLFIRGLDWLRFLCSSVWQRSRTGGSVRWRWKNSGNVWRRTGNRRRRESSTRWRAVEQCVERCRPARLSGTSHSQDGKLFKIVLCFKLWINYIQSACISMIIYCRNLNLRVSNESECRFLLKFVYLDMTWHLLCLNINKFTFKQRLPPFKKQKCIEFLHSCAQNFNTVQRNSGHFTWNKALEGQGISREYCTHQVSKNFHNDVDE